MSNLERRPAELVADCEATSRGGVGADGVVLLPGADAGAAAWLAPKANTA